MKEKDLRYEDQQVLMETKADVSRHNPEGCKIKEIFSRAPNRKLRPSNPPWEDNGHVIFPLSHLHHPEKHASIPWLSSKQHRAHSNSPCLSRTATETPQDKVIEIARNRLLFHFLWVLGLLSCSRIDMAFADRTSSANMSRKPDPRAGAKWITSKRASLASHLLAGH